MVPPPDPAGASPSIPNKRQRLDPIDPNAQPQTIAGEDAFIQDHDAAESGGDDDDDDEKPKSDKKAGRRKIKIEFIQDKSRRHITFSKRKAGIMKKAYELSTLTGTQVLLLVVSETGLVYTFTTAKLQPLVTQPEGKNLIQACLNAPHGQLPSSMPVGTPLGRSSNPMPGGPHTPAPPAPPNVPGGLAIGGNKEEDSHEGADAHDGGSIENVDADVGRGGRKRRRAPSTTTAPTNRNAAAPPPPPPAVPSAMSGPPQQQQPTSPHARAPIPLPSPLVIPPGAQQQSQAQLAMDHAQRGGPQSPSAYAPYPPPPAGDPNAGMYGGYGPPQGAPTAPNPYGYPAPPHDGGAPQGAPPMASWGPPPPGVQQPNHYQRR